jgi:hypothetical protein
VAKDVMLRDMIGLRVFYVGGNIVGLTTMNYDGLPLSKTKLISIPLIMSISDAGFEDNINEMLSPEKVPVIIYNLDEIQIKEYNLLSCEPVLYGPLIDEEKLHEMYCCSLQTNDYLRIPIKFDLEQDVLNYLNMLRGTCNAGMTLELIDRCLRGNQKLYYTLEVGDLVQKGQEFRQIEYTTVWAKHNIVPKIVIFD